MRSGDLRSVDTFRISKFFRSVVRIPNRDFFMIAQASRPELQPLFYRNHFPGPS